jgi:hypothetical protein
MAMLYPRRIEVRRARTVAGSNDKIGLTGYSGQVATTNPSNPQGEQVLFSDIPASVQASTTGRKKDNALPGDAVFAPSWRIFIPKSRLKLGAVRDRDIIVDDEGYRYEVGQAYWNLLGYQLICIRLEA